MRASGVRSSVTVAGANEIPVAGVTTVIPPIVGTPEAMANPERVMKWVKEGSPVDLG
jgi:hypothetical protein